jgi:hypothetical protein
MSDDDCACRGMRKALVPSAQLRPTRCHGRASCNLLGLLAAQTQVMEVAASSSWYSSLFTSPSLETSSCSLCSHFAPVARLAAVWRSLLPFVDQHCADARANPTIVSARSYTSCVELQRRPQSLIRGTTSCTRPLLHIQHAVLQRIAQTLKGEFPDFRFIQRLDRRGPNSQIFVHLELGLER